MPYHSFLVRVLTTTAGERVRLEHIQSGRVTNLPSLREVCTWMDRSVKEDAGAHEDAERDDGRDTLLDGPSLS